MVEAFTKKIQMLARIKKRIIDIFFFISFEKRQSWTHT